ncbi:hypothetical protein LTR94_026129 [Friedmanniomyces endolithicus]|nr:hypothetical protein LTR94_026129 [Friedmanniomyces endolithicus]
MASKSQQKAWLALTDDPDSYVPTGHQLKAWLFGGQSIPARHALFDIEASGLATVADLFGDDRYVADSDAFWTAQNAAIEAKRAAYVEQGWADAIIVPPEAARLAKAEGLDSGGGTGQKQARPEVTSTMQTYIDLHRHAAVRAAMLAHPRIALRLMVAHAITGSHLWSVKPEPQRTSNDAVRESIDNSRAEAEFDEHRRAVLAVLGFSSEEPTVTGGNGDDYGIVGLFQRLLDLPDMVVMDVIAIVMGETLASGSAAVEAVGMEIGVDMTHCWQADDAFFELIRDREVLTRIVAEVAGESVASANAGEKTKTLKRIVRDHLDGTNGRDRRESWVPRWMAFPPGAYSARGGVPMIDADRRACEALAGDGRAGMAGGDRADEMTPALSAVVPGGEIGATGPDLDDPDCSGPGALAPEPLDTDTVVTDASEGEDRILSGAPVDIISPGGEALGICSASAGTMPVAEQTAGHVDVPASDMPGPSAVKAA